MRVLASIKCSRTAKDDDVQLWCSSALIKNVIWHAAIKSKISWWSAKGIDWEWIAIIIKIMFSIFFFDVSHSIILSIFSSRNMIVLQNLIVVGFNFQVLNSANCSCELGKNRQKPPQHNLILPEYTSSCHDWMATLAATPNNSIPYPPLLLLFSVPN